MDKRLGAGIAALIIVGLVVAAIVAGRNEQAAEEEARNAPARFDQVSGRCVGGGEVGRMMCEDQLAQVESSLKNAATAQESYATVSESHRYTDSISDLEAEGLQVPPNVQLTIMTGGGLKYCMEATSQELGGTMHYSSTEGTTRSGPCS